MATQAPVAQEMPAAQPMPAAQAPPPQSSPAMDTRQRGSVLSSVSTSWSPTHWTPKIDSTAHVDGRALVIGNVKIGARVYISAGVIIRGQNEEPVCIGDGSYIQENVVIRDLPSRVGGKVDKMRLVEVDGIEYSVYVGKNVAICAQAQIHGPARIEDGAYIGMQCLIFWAGVAQGAVVEPGCLVMNANVPVGVFVPAGLKILSQKSVKDLPPLTPQYRLYGIGAQTTDEGQEYLSGGMH
jgi:carbonic anhydrase/acetyltransferase-like protein (isoleucine patch superfamily)